MTGAIQKLLGKMGQGAGEDLGTRGSVGGEDQTQTENQSLSDRLRGGDLGGLPSFDFGQMVGTPSTYGGAIMAEGGAEGLRGLGQMTPGGFGAEGAAMPVGTDMSGAAGSIAGMAIGPLLSYLGNMATSDASPEVQAAISGLLQAASPAIAPAAAGAVSGIASGAGALSGAAGGLAAAGPGLIASAPMAAMIIGTSINNMLEQSKLAGQLTDRFGNLQQNLPGHIANLQRVPQLVQQLDSVTDPQQAAALYKQLEQIQTDFDSSGMEDFLQHGITSVTGPSGQGSMSAAFPEGPKIMESLKPFGQMLDYGRLRAQDIAARGGVNIENPRNITDYALSLGGKDFGEAFRPAALLGSGETGQGSLLDLLQLGHSAARGMDVDPNAQVAQPTMDLLNRLGLTGSGYTNQDIINYLNAGGAGMMDTLKNDYDILGSAYSGGIGKVDKNIMAQLQGLQPGQYEQGLRDLYTKGGYTSGNPFFSAGGAPQQQAAQTAQGGMNALGGGGTGAFDAMLSDEQKRAMGLM